VAPVLDDRGADARADLGERIVPRDLPPLARAASAVALERIENAIGIVELIRSDDALRTGAAAAAGMERVAFDLANRQRVLVDVGENAARRLAVEANARNDPVAPAILPGPTGRLVVDVVVPLRRIRMCREGHDRGDALSRFDPHVLPGEAAGQREDSGRGERGRQVRGQRGGDDGDRGGGDAAEPKQPRVRSA
jgi:hypothetical protein